MHARAVLMLSILFLAGAAMPAPAQAKKDRLVVSILKGPSGLAAAWMMASPPSLPGVDLSFSMASSADQVTASLISGEIQAGVLPVNIAAKLYNAGVPIRALAVVGEGMVKLLTSDPRIASLQDLRGREIHIAGQKATPDYLFRYLAGKAGLEPGRDFRPVYNLAYPEMAAQLAAGKISITVLPEPFATQARMLAPTLTSPVNLDRLWAEATGLSGYPMSLFVASSRLSEAAESAILLIEGSYAASIARTNAEPAESGKLAESLGLGMKAAVATAAIPLSAYRYVKASEARGSMETLLGLFLEEDPVSVGGKLPGDGFYGMR
jgi:NitT/TauT family transport system substrate-binding protein